MREARVTGALHAALDGACLTDEELAASPGSWRSMRDPFPAWGLESASD